MNPQQDTRPSNRLRARRLVPALVAVGAVAVLAGACGGPAPNDNPGPPVEASPSSSASTSPSAGATSTPSAGPSSEGPSAVEPAKDQVVVDIAISGDQVKPNGEKLDVPQGATVVLNVTSDVDDEIHAHTGGDGYELEVKAGQPASGRFVVAEPGSFEVESHHSEKVIVVLNVR